MSKRKGNAFVEHYIEQGYFPEAVNNFVALLGWSPQDPENEVLTSDELLAEVRDLETFFWCDNNK